MGYAYIDSDIFAIFITYLVSGNVCAYFIFKDKMKNLLLKKKSILKKKNI